MFWLDPKHNLFPLKVPLLNDPNTFFILLFLIDSAPFSLRGIDFGTCACRSLGRGPRLTGSGQGCQQRGEFIYLSIYLSICLHRHAGKTFGACPGNSYPTCSCGLLCTWVPVSTRVLNAHCPSSLQSPS